MMRCTLAVAAILLAAPLFAQYERILLPVFTPPVHGAFGSEFVTHLSIANNGDTVLSLFGIRYDCDIILSCVNDWVDVEPAREIDSGRIVQDGAPGRFIFVLKNDLDRLSMNLRVQDVTRAELNFGTEMPIVRESEFVNGRIGFYGVPASPQFRNTLRIYAETPIDVLVTVGEQLPVRLALTGNADVFVPAYGVFTDFPAAGSVRVTVQADQPVVSTPVPIWAFITVTNNQTQVITTITPQP